MDPISATGQVDRSQLPADVRSASKEDQARYAAALQFEQILTQRMISQSIGAGDDQDAGSEDEDGLGISGGGDAASRHYEQMLPELMANALTSSGGTGLARTLYDAMRDRA